MAARYDIACGTNQVAIYRDGLLFEVVDSLSEAIEILVPNVVFHEEWDRMEFPLEVEDL